MVRTKNALSYKLDLWVTEDQCVVTRNDLLKLHTTTQLIYYVYSLCVKLTV